jgi:hypothetical protein
MQRFSILTSWRELMRAALNTLLVLSALLDAGTARGQTKIQSKAQLTAPPATSGWKVILRIQPNPLPAGRCAGASVEIQDPFGYRATTLSNGSSIDFHQFLYTSSDTTSFKWQNGQPMFGILCAPVTSTAAQTVVTVTLPDGLTSSVILTTVAPTARVASVQYAPQAPLRLPTSPEYAPGFVASQAPTAAAVGGAGGAVAAGVAPSSDAGVASTAPRPISGTVEKLLNRSASVTTTPLSLVGTYHALSVAQTTPALSLTGTYHALSVAQTTPALSLTGTYHALSVVQTTPALSLTGTYHALSVVQTTTALSLTGTYASPSVAKMPSHALTPKPIPPGAHSP